MDAPTAPCPSFAEEPGQTSGPSRTQSFSQQSDSSQTSQTAAEFIDSQLQLEAEAREALPYKFEKCTNPIGKLRQQIFSCLTCNPPPSNPSDPYTAAGVCYSCSISCHGEHTLVELFNKRDFVCDCGTTRLPATSHCTLRINSETNTKGGVHSEEPAPDNGYNQNFKNRFCGCECDYDAYAQRGTMFQCLGIGTTETGGCGEDWWHPGCLVGLGPNWDEASEKKRKPKNEGFLESITEVAEAVVDEKGGNTKTESTDSEEPAAPTETAAAEVGAEEQDPPLPPGFPAEDDFEGFMCYKCVEANPWIKRYAGTAGFLAPVFRRSTAPSPETGILGKAEELIASHLPIMKKRQAEDDEESITSKRHKDETSAKPSTDIPLQADTVVPTACAGPEDGKGPCKPTTLPPAPTGQISLFFKDDFREHLCRCSSCFPLLQPNEHLLEEEELYEPSVSDDWEEAGGSTVGSGSIYDRGQSALKNIDRVRAIEGVMAYNHLKDKLKPFFQQFAESGQPISAEDIKAHFAKMRGDEQAMKDAGMGAKRETDNREEQGGY